MSKASAALKQITEALPTVAELPLSAFNITITRLDQGKVRIKLTKGDTQVEVTGKHGKRIKIDHQFITIPVADKVFAIAACPDFWAVNDIANFRAELKRADGAELEWKAVNDEYSVSPSQDSLKKLDRAIVEVAERILTRFSRVDLL